MLEITELYKKYSLLLKFYQDLTANIEDLNKQTLALEEKMELYYQNKINRYSSNLENKMSDGEKQALAKLDPISKKIKKFLNAFKELNQDNYKNVFVDNQLLTAISHDPKEKSKLKNNRVFYP